MDPSNRCPGRSSQKTYWFLVRNRGLEPILETIIGAYIGVPKIRGTLFGGPYSKDPTI